MTPLYLRSRMQYGMPKQGRGICIFPTRLGDTVIALAAFNALLDKYPQYCFTVVCSPLMAPIFKNFRQCDEVIHFKKATYKRHWISLCLKLLFRHFDLLVDMRSSCAHLLIRASKKIRNNNKSVGVLRRISLLTSFKLPCETLPKIILSKEDTEWAALKMGKGAWVGICPTAGWKEKCWSIDNFINLSHLFISKGYKVALFYGAGEEEKRIVKPLLQSIPEVLDLGGGNNITHIAAAIKLCKLFVGNDSGLSHLAAAVDTKTLALFGPTNAGEYAPSGKHVTVLVSPGRAGKGRMDLITLKNVRGKINELLKDRV